MTKSYPFFEIKQKLRPKSKICDTDPSITMFLTPVENFKIFTLILSQKSLFKKIKVKKMFFIYHFSRLSLTIKLFIPLDREMYSLSFDVGLYHVNIKCIGTEKTTMTQIVPYQLLSILKTVGFPRSVPVHCVPAEQTCQSDSGNFCESSNFEETIFFELQG